MGSLMSKAIDWGRRKSPWIIHFNAGACNGCDIEVVDALTPRFDIERFGMLQQGTPRHADVLVCTGAVTLQTRDRLKQIYEQMLEPKFVIAVGTCACTAGIFDGCYCVAGGIDAVIPVDVYLPGCAARPEALIDAVVKLLSTLEEQQKSSQKAGAKPKDERKGAARSVMAAEDELPKLPQSLFSREPQPQAAAEQAPPINHELVQAWQTISSAWNNMTEKEKEAAAELWAVMGEAEKAALSQTAHVFSNPHFMTQGRPEQAANKTAAPPRQEEGSL